MEVGIHVPQVGPLANRQTVGEFAKAADEAGFDALWVFDHVVLQKNQQSKYPYSADGSLGFPPTMDFLEPLTLLTWLAGITTRAKLGTSVLVLPMRQPVLHAKIMATIDHLSGGRMILGAGVGWWEQEFEVLGVPFEKRGARFDQDRVGLHHLCFRARARADVDAVHRFVAGELRAKIVHPPEEGAWAPGYYSVLFEDPDGIRVEVNFVPGRGHLDRLESESGDVRRRG